MNIFNDTHGYLIINRDKKSSPTIIKLILVIILVFFVGTILGTAFIPNIYLLLKYPEIKQFTLDYATNVISFSEYLKIMQTYLESIPIYINLLSYFVVFASISVFIFVFEKRNVFSLGLKDKLGFYKLISGISCGAILSVVLVLLLKITSIEFIRTDFQLNILHLLLTILGWAIYSLVNELIFRGWLLQNIGEKYSGGKAIILSALFATILNGIFTGVSFISLINGFVFAFLLNIVTLYTGSIYSSWGISFSLRAIPSIIIGLISNGFVNNQPFYEINYLGQDIITGGTYGVEFGLMMTLLLCLCGGIIILKEYLSYKKRDVTWH